MAACCPVALIRGRAIRVTLYERDATKIYSCRQKISRALGRSAGPFFTDSRAQTARRFFAPRIIGWPAKRRRWARRLTTLDFRWRPLIRELDARPADVLSLGRALGKNPASTPFIYFYAGRSYDYFIINFLEPSVCPWPFFGLAHRGSSRGRASG